MKKKARAIIEKIWDAHVVKHLEGQPAILAIDLHLIHEVTSAQAFKELEMRGLKVFEPERTIATIDHAVPTRQDRQNIKDVMARIQIETLRKNVEKYSISICDLGSGKQGIVHVIGPELGLTQPGMTIVCGDSHTSTHGALGAMAFGIGTTEVFHVLATGCLLQYPSQTMKVEFGGDFQKGVYPKDAILALIRKIGVGGGNSHIIEYTGRAIKAMCMSERMTVCNMSIECGARAGLISPDEVTFRYLKGRPCAPKESEWEGAVEFWKSLATDLGAVYDKTVMIDVNTLEPMVTWGTNPAQAIQISEKIPEVSSLAESSRSAARAALEYVKLEENQPVKDVQIQWAFLGSCTNARIEDLRVAAALLEGKKVNKNVTMYVVPGSESVRDQAIREGLAGIFEEAGAEFRMPGCSMCLAMNDDRVPDGERCISSSNRNFVGRQGAGSITHLASPAMVSAAAIAGRIVDVREYL